MAMASATSGGSGGLGELAEHGDGTLDLLFGRVAVAGDGAFDHGAGEAGHREAALGGGQEDGAAGVAHEDGGARMFVMGVKLFDGDLVGLQVIEEGGEGGVEFEEAFVEFAAGLHAEDAGLAEGGPAGDRGAGARAGAETRP
jgi:hypothetical protein